MSLDFTKQMKKEYTIIAPDIFPTHMELLSELFSAARIMLPVEIVGILR